MARIFLSYSRSDGGRIAEELVSRLRAMEHEVFFDVQSIKAGQQWRDELQRRVIWSDLVAVLVTPGSNDSDWVYEEISQASKYGKVILPIQVEDTPLPVYLRGTWQAAKYRASNIDAVLLDIQSTLTELPKSQIEGRPIALWSAILMVALLTTSILVFLLLGNNGEENIKEDQIGQESNVTATSSFGLTETSAPLTDTLALAPTQTFTFEPTNTAHQSTPASTDNVSSTLTPVPTQIAEIVQAELGVGKNDEWKPYGQIFNGTEMMLVPKGCFLPSHQQVAGEQEPQEFCFDSPYWIDKTEVTREKYMHCVKDNRCVEPTSNSASTEDDQPINALPRIYAEDYCKWRNARLPTENEWEYAAAGPENWAYPWGNEFTNDFFLPVTFGVTSPVGSNRRDKSWVGAYDMSGNLREWVENEENNLGIIRGGYFSSETSAELLTNFRLLNRPRDFFDSYGFRCARSYN